MKLLLIALSGLLFLTTIACLIAAGISLAEGGAEHATGWARTAGFAMIGSLACGLAASP